MFINGKQFQNTQYIKTRCIKKDFYQTIVDLIIKLLSNSYQNNYRAPVIKTLVINKSDQHPCLHISPNTVNILNIALVCCGS